MRVPTTMAIVSLFLAAIAATACSGASGTTAAAPASGAAAAAASSPSASSQPAASSGSSSSSSGGGSSADLNACSLLTPAKATALTGKRFSGAKPQTIATGQDACTYKYTGPNIDMTVIVYQPTSGVSWDALTGQLSSGGSLQQVSGVGDKAMANSIQLDAQAGDRFIAVTGAGDDSAAGAVAKAVIAALP